MTGEPDYYDWATRHTEQSARILENIGIRVAIDWLPEYVKERDALARMAPLRQWLSRRRRRRFGHLRNAQQARILEQVLTLADRRSA